MTEPYRPSNGTEGAIFMARFCDQCARHCEDKPCEILGRTLLWSIDDEDYPKEWVQSAYGGNPRCTAFIPEGEKLPEERCKDTIEMF